MKVDDAIAAGIEAIQREAYDGQSIQRVKSAVLVQLDEHDRVSVVPMRDYVTRRRWLRGIGLSAVAAGVVCVAFDPFGFVATKTLYAQAIDNLKLGGLYYVMTKAGHSEGSQCWIAEDGRRRHVSPGVVTISDEFGNPLLYYTVGEHAQKSAMLVRTTLKSSPTRFEESWFKVLEKNNEATLIGEETIANGSITEHYRVEPKDPELVFDVWIDPRSRSIVRVEFEETRHSAPAEALGKYVISDIKSNQDFDPSLFSTEPPAGYEITVVGEPAK